MSMSQEEIDALINSGGLENLDQEQTEEKAEEKVETQKSEENEISKFNEESILTTIDPKLELLYDLQLPVSIELGRTNMLIRNILRLGRGSVIEFEKLVSEPVDVLINGKKVAEGEVVVIDKHFGIRITTLVDPSDRIKTIRK